MALPDDMVPRQSQVVGIIRKEVDMLQTVTGDATFGQAPTFNTDTGFMLALSPDKKAFTATFSGLEVIIEGKSAPPIVTRVFSFSIPLADAKPGQEIPFFVSGTAEFEKGANAQLVFTVNDQSMTAYFPAQSKEGFVHRLNYKATDATEARVTVFLLANRDSKSGASVFVNVSAIDTDIAKH
jgi:hypothetical protein